MSSNRKIRKQNDQDLKVYLKQGDQLFSINKYEESMKFYDLVIKINPECFQALINRGLYQNTYYMEGAYSFKKLQPCSRNVDKAQEVNPLDYQVHLNKGLINGLIISHQLQLHDVSDKKDSDLFSFSSKSSILHIDNLLYNFNKSFEIDHKYSMRFRKLLFSLLIIKCVWSFHPKYQLHLLSPIISNPILLLRVSSLETQLQLIIQLNSWVTKNICNDVINSIFKEFLIGKNQHRIVIVYSLKQYYVTQALLISLKSYNIYF